jgi:hypothetical protein
MLLRAHFVLLCTGAVLLVAVPAPQVGDKPDKSKLRIRPGFSDTYQVGFTLLDKDGKPQRITFDDKGGTNVVVVRVDGKDHAFGFEGGTFKSKNVALGKDRVGAAIIWAVDKIEITQTVETVQSKTGQWDTCVVSYTAKNSGDKAHAVGIRVMLDTHLGSSSKQVFQVAGAKEIISDKADWQGAKVPPVLVTMQKANVAEPGLTATLSLRCDGGIEPPGRVVLTQFPERDIAFGWDLPVKDMANDAVVGLFWSPKELKAGETRTMGYGYGAGVLESAKKLGEKNP